HPGAVRKLIEVLRRYPQHQYIVATHSPTVITAAEPSTITVIKRVGGKSVFEPLDPSNTKHLQVYLAEIGSRLADVFGADNVIFVEGRTEEICFPRILEKISQKGMAGTVIRAVQQTGDLLGDRKKRAELAFDIYSQISSASSIIPPAIAFVFDKEGRSQDDQR